MFFGSQRGSPPISPGYDSPKKLHPNPRSAALRKYRRLCSLCLFKHTQQKRNDRCRRYSASFLVIPPTFISHSALPPLSSCALERCTTWSTTCPSSTICPMAWRLPGSSTSARRNQTCPDPSRYTNLRTKQPLQEQISPCVVLNNLLISVNHWVIKFSPNSYSCSKNTLHSSDFQHPSLHEI